MIHRDGCYTHDGWEKRVLVNRSYLRVSIIFLSKMCILQEKKRDPSWQKNTKQNNALPHWIHGNGVFNYCTFG